MNPTSIIKIPDNFSEQSHKGLAKEILKHKIDGIELSNAGGAWGATWETHKDYDLEFLKFYKGIKTLRLYLPGVTNLNPILNLADSIVNLHLGEFNSKKISFDLLSGLPNIECLSVVRQPTGLESITKLPKLTELSLTGYSVDKLNFLNSLQKLKRLYIGFGTSKNLDTINQLKNLEELDILWVKQLSDIKAISNLSGLIRLKIQYEKQVTKLPDLSKLKKLKNIRLMDLNALSDVSSLSTSHIEEFVVTGPNKNADFLKSISKSTRPNKVFTYFYSKKEQAKAEQLLGKKFFAQEKMNHHMDEGAKLIYHDVKTFKRIEL
jgi:hypothetical protein